MSFSAQDVRRYVFAVLAAVATPCWAASQPGVMMRLADHSDHHHVAMMINGEGKVQKVPAADMRVAYTKSGHETPSRDWTTWGTSKDGPLTGSFEDTRQGVSELHKPIGWTLRPSTLSSRALIRAVSVGCVFGVVRSLAADNLSLLYESSDARDMARSFQRALWAGGYLGVFRLFGMAFFLGLWMLVRSGIDLDINDMTCGDYVVGVSLVLASLQFALNDPPVPQLHFDKAKMCSNDAFVAMPVPTIELQTTKAVSTQNVHTYGIVGILELVGAACIWRLGTEWSPAFVGAFVVMSAICNAVLARCLIPTCSSSIAAAEVAASAKRVYRASCNLVFMLGAAWTGAWLAEHVYDVKLTERLYW